MSDSGGGVGGGEQHRACVLAQISGAAMEKVSSQESSGWAHAVLQKGRVIHMHNQQFLPLNLVHATKGCS